MMSTDKSKEEAMNDYITKVKQLQEEAAAAGLELELEGSLVASASLGDGGGGGGGGEPKEAVHATMSSSRRTCTNALSSSYSPAL